MSQELIDAARDGDLETVKHILAANPECMNFIGNLTKRNHPREPEIFYWGNGVFALLDITTTALRAALYNKQTKVALFLLNQGAKFENEADRKISLFHDRYPTVLSMFSDFPQFCEVDSFKHILRISTNIIDFLNHNYNGTNLSYFPALLSLCLHEAIIRNERRVFANELFIYNPRISEIKLDTDSMNNYLGTRHLNAKQSEAAYGALKYLLHEKRITDVSDIIKVVNIHHTLAEDELAAIKNLPTRTLEELFAEFQHWVYPEEGLPLLPIKNMERFTKDLIPLLRNKTYEEIQSWQTPLKLRDFLLLDKTEILKRLNCAAPENNVAVVILQTILNYLADSEIQLDEQKTVLLSNEEQEAAQEILNHYYALSDLEKMNLHHQFQSEFIINHLVEKNNQLTTEVDLLRKEMDCLKQQFLQLTNKVSSENDTHSVRPLKFFS